jgi:RHS repeat-associated protein
LINKYLYNGKEQQDQTGWYAYGFRRLGPQLGRWHVANAMAENYTSQSPYNYVGNNPISRTDFMGLTYSRKNLEWQQFVTETEQLNYRYGHRSGSGGWGSILDPRNSYGHYYYEQVNMLGTVDDIQNTTINDVVSFIFKNDGVSVFLGNNSSGFFGHDKQGNLYSLVINGFGRINFTGKVRVSDIITTNADGSRGVNWEGLADYFGDNDFVTIDDDGTTNWGGLVPDWDNAFIRAFTGDIVTAGGGIPIMPGLSLSLNFSWVIHGREASWKPVVSTTVTVSGNSVLSPGAFIGGENLLNGADKITRNLVKTSFTEGDKSFVFGYSFFSGEVTPTNAGYLFGRYLNTGESIFGGISNTLILHDFYKN